MKKTLSLLFVFGLLISSSMAHAVGDAPPCSFMQDAGSAAPRIALPTGAKSILIDNYFRIFYSVSDKKFAGLDASGQPEILARYIDLFERSRHFLQTELGWKLPVTRVESNHPELQVYFIPAAGNFRATTRAIGQTVLIFNSDALSAKDFPSIWMHQLAHAAQLEYRRSGDYWFYEATAGWMEAQFDAYSEATKRAIAERLAHPEVSITDSTAGYALGGARFVDVLSRPYKDIIRQIWERWNANSQETLLQVIQNVLSLNHLPTFESYVQNYFLLSSAGQPLDSDSENIAVKPLAAAVFEEGPAQSNGGLHLSFTPTAGTAYAASLVFYASGQKSGTLAMKNGLTEPWKILVPFGGLDHYKLVIVNNTQVALQGTILKTTDSTIPAVLEYFRVNPGDGGVQIEWKTAKENGVAFWNLYTIRNGQKQLLNSYPIPASIDSQEGVHYLFIDTSNSAFYSLEAITSEGFQSPLAGKEKPQ